MEVWELSKEYKIDNRNRQDLLAQIERLAQSYTPEWKFDLSKPDAISVIGIIFANQMIESIKNMNQVLTRYHIEFANMYGTSLKAPIPSRTICTFKVNENMQSGAALKRGTQVIGTNENGDEIVFALCHDINVATAELTEILAVSGTEKKAVAYKGEFKAFHYGDGQLYRILPDDGMTESIPLFGYQGENIHKQAVIMYFHRFPNIHKNGIRLKFHGNLSSEMLSRLFSDRKKFIFSYLSEEGAVPFDEVISDGEFVEMKNKSVILSRNMNGEEMSAVILEMKDPVDDNISLNRIEMFAAGHDEKPEFLWNERNEILQETFLPFTEQPALYNEFYIGQSFLLEQYGAKVILQFRLDFAIYSSQNAAIYEPDLRIIKRKPKKMYPGPHYECRIQEVSFDYFNGRGWRHLETNTDMSALFSREENAGEYSISFEVPSDWKPVVQGGYEGNCIRMQIVRADNCYMSEIEYHYPVISDIRIHMDEQIKGTLPCIVLKLQGETTENVTGKIVTDESFAAFTQMPYSGDYVFLGFNRHLGKGPVALFLELEKPLSIKGIELGFAYSGLGGFQSLKVIDNTDALQNSGLILFMPPADMAEYNIEGVRKYWIRIEDKNRSFAHNRDYVPMLRKIHMNAAYVENVIVKEEQDYYIDDVTSYMRFSLYAENILSAQVWVNEKEQLSADEMNQMHQNKDIETRIEYNFLGEIEEFYVLWNEVESFDNAEHMDRCYCIDRSKNELIFGDGVHSRVPQNTNGIAFKTKVVCCDGEAANVKAHRIDRFRKTIVSVEDITNPVDAYGGTNLEDVKNALMRGNNLLSSRKRMVSETDYMKEALSFSDLIEQAVCVTGLTKDKKKDDSVISIVLLMKDYQKGDYSFRNIQNKLKEHLLNCCEVTCDLSDIQIVEPVFVWISIELWLLVPDISKSLEIKQSWTEKITEYFEPVKNSESSGWKIGKLPSMNQIRLMLSTLEGNVNVQHFNVAASYTDNQRLYEMNLDRVETNPFMICCNGEHNIYINGI